MNIYFPRFSFFIILVRMADDPQNYAFEDGSKNKGNWRDLGIRGGVQVKNRLIDFNYIRIKHPREMPSSSACSLSRVRTSGTTSPPRARRFRSWTPLRGAKELLCFGSTDSAHSRSSFEPEYYACGISTSPLMLGKEGDPGDRPIDEIPDPTPT